MDSESVDSSNITPARVSDIHPTPPANAEVSNVSSTDASPKQLSGISSWARNLKIPLPMAGGQDESPTGNSAKSAFAQFTSGIASRLSPRDPIPEQGTDGASQSNFIGSITKGIVDSSKSAVRAVQVKARHVVSQNKRRYQEDGYDLDMTYITENIIAMGFPAGDMSSGFFGFVEGFYRNHMEEVISFLESHHKDTSTLTVNLLMNGRNQKYPSFYHYVRGVLFLLFDQEDQGKYKVYNLCSERLYDASLFEGKVASFPFDDHNCPPIHLIKSFCQSAYSWLKEDIENVVVVHCKAGMARTGLMISSLLLYLKFFPTAEESIDYYNQKRCFDAKGLVLPSQIRYVKYFERILTYFNGENQPGRRCMLRGFRLHRCPYWIRPHITVSNHNGVLFSTKKHPRTKDLSPEDFWFTAPKKGIMVFALPGEPGLAELAGDFKVHFHDRQGDFYFWLNTTMTENRKILYTGDMDGFDKRKLPSPGFQVELVLVDYDGTSSSPPPQPKTAVQSSDGNPGAPSAPVNGVSSAPNPHESSHSQPQIESQDKDDVFSDDEGNEPGSSRSKTAQAATATKPTGPSSEADASSGRKVDGLAHEFEKTSLDKGGSVNSSQSETSVGGGASREAPSSGVSEFKAMAADASVFTFGDEEDYESE